MQHGRILHECGDVFSRVERRVKILLANECNILYCTETSVIRDLFYIPMSMAHVLFPYFSFSTFLSHSLATPLYCKDSAKHSISFWVVSLKLGPPHKAFCEMLFDVIKKSHYLQSTVAAHNVLQFSKLVYG